MALSDADKIGRIRRFYKEVSVQAEGGGVRVLLDARPAKTPAGAVLALPAWALAEQVADEWSVQTDHIEFTQMPATRLAFTAIDRAAAAREGLAKSLARQAQADALCYLAEAPPGLVERQAAAWTPWRDWAERVLDLPFTAAVGVIHQPQPPQTLARVEALAAALDDFTLSGLAFAAGLYESAILAIAVQRRALDAVEAFELSRLEEIVQAEQWGLDAEAQARTHRLRAEAAMLEGWFGALV